MGLLFWATVLWVCIGLVGAMWQRHKSPWFAFSGGTALALYGAIPSIGLSIDGNALGNVPMVFAGQFLLFFFSVVGGSIVSTSWSELRTAVRINRDSMG